MFNIGMIRLTSFTSSKYRARIVPVKYARGQYCCAAGCPVNYGQYNTSFYCFPIKDIERFL